MRNKPRVHALLLSLFLLALAAPAFAQGYGESPYIFGIHDPGGEQNMADKGKKGWILFTEKVGRNYNDSWGKDYRPWADQGYGVIVRINHGYGTEGTIPYDKHYDAFADRAARFVTNSRGAHIWIIGNETNLAQEWPAYEGWTQQISPSLYATCYKKCRAKIKALAGHSGDQVLTQATGPWNVQSGMGWIAYHAQMLNLIGQGNVDGLALHTYTHGGDPNLIFSESRMAAPYSDCYYNFRTYRDWLNANPAWAKTLPVYITETNQAQNWVNTNSGWVRNAYSEIHNWNKASGTQKIRALILYRWNRQVDPHGFGDLWGVVSDLRSAMDNDYRWDTFLGDTSDWNSTDDPSGEPTVLADGSLRWQAEDYSGGSGAQSGVDYYDTDAANLGGKYRTHGVDIETCSEGGYNVGWIYAGEWLHYKFSGGGTYRLEIRHAAASSNASARVEVDGVNVSGSVALPATGGWQTWRTASSDVFTLADGNHNVKFIAGATGFNVNHFTFVPAAPPATGEPDVIVESLSVSPANPEPGDSVTFTSVVRNIGAEATPAGQAIGVGYRIDGVQVTWGSVPGPLAAGAAVTVGTNGGPWTATAGQHQVTAVADDINRFPESDEGNNTRSINIDVQAAATGPNGEPTVLADGTLHWEAEDYTGGNIAQNNVDYYDTDLGNVGGAYRQQDVDIESCSEGGFNVGWIYQGEWLRYVLDGGGTFQIEVRYACTSDKSMHIEVDGVNVSGNIPLANTGGWQNWATATGNQVTLGSGAHTIKVVADGTGFNLNHFRFKPVTAPPPPPPPPPPTGPDGTPTVLADGTLHFEAEDYSGEGSPQSGVDYSDTTAGNDGGAYRTDGVDIESCSEGGYNVGWTAQGEWTHYTFSGAGTYQVQVRYAASWNAQVHVQVDGANVSGAVALNSTGGWQNWATATGGTFTVGSGTHNVYFVADSNGYNVNYFRFKPVSAPPPPPGQCDVVVDSVTLSPASPQAGQAVTFTAVVRNIGGAATPADQAIGVGYRINNAQVTWGSVPGPLAAGASVTIGTHGGSWTAVSGTHTLTAVADDINRFPEANESNNSKSVQFSVAGTPPPAGGEIYAVGLDPANSKGRPSAAELKALGARWVRIEWKLGSGYALYDPYIASLRSAGIKVLLIVDYVTVSGRPNPNDSDSAWLSYISKFKTEVGAIAAHYGNGIDAWQIWNEPDLPPQPGYEPYIRPNLYGIMLRDSYNAIKARSSSPVVTAGMASGNPYYLVDAKNAAGGLYCDGVSVHPYGQRAADNWPNPDWGFGNMSTLLNNYYNILGKPIWVTECGVNTTDQNFQAEYLQRAYATCISMGSKVKHVFWFCWTDAMVPPYGLHDASLNKKAAYYRYQSIAGSW